MATTSKSLWRVLVFFALAIGGTVADLATKSWIFNRLGFPEYFDPEKRAAQEIVLWPGVFSFTTSLNEGALFGIGGGLSLVFAALALVAVAGIVYWLFWGGGASDWWMTITLGLILGGVLGNLYDRIGLHGLIWPPFHPKAGEPVHAVRDWLHFEIEAINFDYPVFNLADCFLVVGAIMLFWHAIYRDPKTRIGRKETAEKQ